MRRIVNHKDLNGHGNVEGRRILTDIMETGLKAADPYNNTTILFQRAGNKLILDDSRFEIPGDPNAGRSEYDLDEIERVYIFGIGKGIARVTKALEDIIGDRITDGYVLGKHGDELIMKTIPMSNGGHPVPDAAGMEGCRRIVEIIEGANFTKNDLVITAVGNGIGSLCTYPVECIPIDDVTEMTRLMQIEYGAPTGDLNYVRNSIDRVKGGRLARMIHPAKMVHLFGVPPIGEYANYSDYDGLMEKNVWLHTIADGTTIERAIEVIHKWDVEEKCPRSVIDYLKKEAAENPTVRYDEYRTYDTRCFGVMPIELSARVCAMNRAEELGYKSYYLIKWLQTEAAAAGLMAAQIACSADEGINIFKPPCAIFTTGELLVTAGDNPGVGGRNQEYCAAAAGALAGNKRIVMAGVDTDGTDGPGGEFHPDATSRGITVLAGGIVDGYTEDEAKRMNIDLHKALQTHSTSAALWELGSGIAATHNISIGDLNCALIMDHDRTAD